jgi:hypothetical protein
MQRKYRLVCGSRKRCRSHDASVLPEGHMLSIAKYWRKVVATSPITCSTREPLYHPFYRLLSTNDTTTPYPKANYLRCSRTRPLERCVLH